jgi:hypothetical protein
MIVCDFEDYFTLSVIGNVGELIMNMPASDFKNLYDENT